MSTRGIEQDGARLMLGPFAVEAPIGRGAMAEVWRGRHVGQDVAVAIKVMSSRVAQDERWRAAFSEEVRAVARLHHPNIILVFDHGVVPASVSERTRGALPAGAAWLAMELAEAGSLDQLNEVLCWKDLRAVLLALLDALAHAHARGVIHRDLKPANILLGSASARRPGLKLSDFGLAHLMGAELQLDTLSGTPRFMAPEQFRSDWRSFGPWTDLYALGCLAWQLSVGTPPFWGRDVRILGHQHLYSDPPALEPRRAVPAGFEDWLLRLLEKEPSDRFACAADAAWALSRLGDPGLADEGVMEATPLVISNPTLTLDETFFTEVHTEVELPEPELAEEVLRQPSPMAALPPPIPSTWKRASPPPPSIRLVGAGLGLYGLRTIPMVDRVLARDRVWAALRGCQRAAEVRTVVLRGASGTGKSRLAAWMSERAHEVGAAEVLQAVHSAQRGGADGLGAMWVRHLGLLGLGRAEVEARLQARAGSICDASEVLALAELVCPAPEAHLGPVVRLGSDVERYVLMERLLKRMAAVRPVVLWLDDVQWGADALRFAHHLLQRGASSALLVLITVQEEALAARPLEQELLQSVVEHPRSEVVAVGPLEREDRAELVRELLGLSGTLAAQVEERCGGNPLFAVQLVGDWVGRELLVPGPAGFELREGARSELPDGIHEVWSGRIARALGTDGADEARAGLELAAALGQDVREDEWSAVCAAAGLVRSDALVDSLQLKSLATRSEGGWSFAHGMVRESIERQAVERGVWPVRNGVCARVLQARGADPARVGRHWLLAGNDDLAVDALLLAARQQLDTTAHRVARSTLESASALLGQGERSEDRRHVALALLWSELCETGKELAEADRYARRAEELAIARGWRRELAQTWFRRGCLAKSLGDVPGALELHRRAIEAFEALGDDVSAARGRVGVAEALILQGEVREATREVEVARDVFGAADDKRGLVGCVRCLGDLARLRLDWEESSACFARAMELFDELGDRGGYAANLHGLAEIQRLQGRLDEAEAGYRACIALDEQVGRSTIIPRFNLGLCLTARAHHAEADAVFEPLELEWARQGNRAYEGLARMARLPAAAAARDWERFDDLLASGTERLEAAGMVDLDIAQAAELAGDLCSATGEGARAASAWALAARQWGQLDATQDRERVEGKLR